MDLGAYANIERLRELAKKNLIYVPRLRGYRLMVEQKPADRKQIAEMKIDIAYNELRDACSNYFGGSSGHWLTCETRRMLKKATVSNGNGPQVNWSAIHGKKRRYLKYEIKKSIRNMMTQYAIWNKYCGHTDVMYIHARVGGGNWETYRDQVQSIHGYIESVNDYFDETYRDIYVRLEVGE